MEISLVLLDAKEDVREFFNGLSFFYLKKEVTKMIIEKITDKEKEPILIGAARLMEDVFESGLYRKMKTADKKLEDIKMTIRKQYKDGESKRYELPHNLVAKFIPNPTYETDEIGLKMYLDDYGLLPQTISIKANSFKEEPDLLDSLRPFLKPVEYFAQFYLNKAGKAHIDKEEYLYSGNIEELALRFIEEKTSLKESKTIYKKIMKKIQSCPILRQSQAVKSTYGTCKLRKKEMEYHVNSLYNEYGSDFLLKHGQISMKNIEEFIAKGYFSSKDIQQFRKLVAIDLRFVIMDKDTEVKTMEFFHNQTMRKAQMRRFA